MEAVQVALRIRPLSQDEITKGCDECIEVVSGEPQVQIKELAYTFNYVFPPDVGQKELYDTAVKRLIRKLFEGYNGTILAYGQTGSGKTYTMGTDYAGCDGDVTKLGVIPQAVSDIFKYVEENKNEFIFKVKVSFMELYQEQCFDLLSGKARELSIVEIREDSSGVILRGITELPVFSIAETMAALFRGLAGRVTGATAMNQTSSRSHAVFTLTISKESRTDKNLSTTSKFHLVDLAGSERIKKTKASGERLREGVKINQGLLALGNVISALGDGTHKAYIGYRDSKLTRLLQDSLGGNSLTLMVACVSPADYNLDETVSTMRYADRARKIKNKPIINQDPKTAEIVRLNNIINDLRLQLIGNKPSAVSEINYEKLHEEDQIKIAELHKRLKLLTNHLNSILVENANLNERALLSEQAKEKVNRKLPQLIKYCNDSLHTCKSFTTTVTEQTLNSPNSDHQNTYVIEQLQDMKSHLEAMQTENLKSEQALIDHDIILSLNKNACDVDGIDVGYDNDEVALEEEERTLGQVALTKQLQELKHAMAVKVTIMQAMEARNKEILDSQNNLSENEETIKQLEKEKEKLLQQLKQMKNKDPSHEEYRAKVALLESNISDLKKRCQQQENIIKLKQKNEDKIATLTAELHSMKLAKVKIVKQMRDANEKFRKWKAESERALLRLKDADRKRAAEIVKKESLQEKKHTVLKRKMEEAIAVNKRLKEALEQQKKINMKRNTKGSTKLPVIQQYLERELEVHLSVLEAEKSLDELMEYRALITEKIKKLRNATDDEANRKKIAELEEDLALRKAQISDLQQKILAVDQENKARTQWENIESMQEAKVALKYLFDRIIETKKDMHHQCTSYKTQYEQLKEDSDRMRVEYANAKLEFEKQNADMKRKFDEEVAALMALQRGLSVVPGNNSDACKLLHDVIKEQQEKLNQTENENARLVRDLKNLQEVLKQQYPSTIDIVDLVDSDESDKGIKDQDKTSPVVSSGHSTFDPDVILAICPIECSSSLHRLPMTRFYCLCRGICATKRCACMSSNRGCGDACRCLSTECRNQRAASSNHNKENNAPGEAKQLSAVSNSNFFDLDMSPPLIKKKKRYFISSDSDDE